MAEVEITELSKMEAEESHLVGMAANGYPTLISKGLAEMVEEEIEAAKALDLSGAPREVAAKSVIGPPVIRLACDRCTHSNSVSRACSVSRTTPSPLPPT